MNVMLTIQKVCQVKDVLSFTNMLLQCYAYGHSINKHCFNDLIRRGWFQNAAWINPISEASRANNASNVQKNINTVLYKG